MESSPISSRIWTALTLAVLCFVVGYFFTNKYYAKYTAAKAELSLHQSENEELKNTLDTTDGFLATFKGKNSELEKVNQALPPHKSDTDLFISNLSGLAGQSGVVLSNVQMTEADDPGAAVNSIRSVVINLTASGSYNSVKDFVLRLENNLRLSDLVSIVATLDEESGLLAYQMVFKIYYQK